jgi:hypothetical protein
MSAKAQLQHLRDQLKFAKEGADNLAKRSGYYWSDWLKAPNGKCTASFDREDKRWSLSFTWTPREELGELAKRIEHMDYLICIAMKEFAALKLGAAVRDEVEQKNRVGTA